MNHVRRSLAVLAATLLVPVTAFAQKVIFTAAIDTLQEVPARSSPATGHAVMTYDVAANTFDLTVQLRDFSETLNASHIHEAIAGVNGPVKVNLGGEAAYKRVHRRLFLHLKDQPYTGDPVQLLTGGAYVNFHTTTFPGGAVRGQLLPHSVTLFAILSGDQETTPNGSSAKGLAVVRYDFLNDTADAVVKVFNFTNTLADSHIHQAAPGVNGPVVVGFGGAAVYEQSGNNYCGVFLDKPFNGDVLQLLGGNAYVNVHSNVFPGGEIRGQLRFLFP